jgi:hypothetical protein
LLKTLVDKYEAIVENIEIDSEGGLHAIREINTNTQILIIPTANVMSSEEKYQFSDYFNKNSKEKLVGRLLIERFIGTESFYYKFIESLPQSDKLEDWYHFSESNREEFNKRSLVKYTFTDRKADFDALMTKVPPNVLNTLI